MQKHWKCVDLNLFWTKNVIEVRRSSWLSIFLSLSLMVLHLCVCLSLGSPFSISLPPYVGRSSWFSISLPPGFLPPFIRRSSWISIFHLSLSFSLSPMLPMLGNSWFFTSLSLSLSSVRCSIDVKKELDHVILSTSSPTLSLLMVKSTIPSL